MAKKRRGPTKSLTSDTFLALLHQAHGQEIEKLSAEDDSGTGEEQEAIE